VLFRSVAGDEDAFSAEEQDIFGEDGADEFDEKF
jgi:hypothetical protein